MNCWLPAAWSVVSGRVGEEPPELDLRLCVVGVSVDRDETVEAGLEVAGAQHNNINNQKQQQ